jgi:predicted metal-dependent hydrolase
MQTEFLFRGNPARAGENSLDVAGKRIPLLLAKHPRARRYVLRLCPDGTARVTVPRGGSAQHALDFARRQTAWLEKQLFRQARRLAPNRAWPIGTKIVFRGAMVELIEVEHSIHFAGQTVRIPSNSCDLRPTIEAHLRRLAQTELPAETFRLAAAHRFTIAAGQSSTLHAPRGSTFLRRVVVRNQKSRWGSCSRRGTISLNWRLVQTPVLVRDYIILHELAHLRFMNHSKRFWNEVARLCPDYQKAETWLKENSEILR